ncbi:MAG: hypothetical protein RL338_227 [Chloroflexota bacterium]
MTSEMTPTSPLASFVEAPLTRRRFLAATAGALVVGFVLEPRATRAAVQPPIGADPAGANINGWVVVDGAGVITILYGGAEMGQGSSTGLAQLVAEELGAKWSDVVVQYVPTNLSWTTGGSSGITRHFADMRVAGAQAREMLKAAAAARWGLASTAGLVASDSTVRNPANSDGTTNTLSYASLAALAATMPVPDRATVPLLKSGQYVGVSMPRLDIPGKTDGSAKFGIDVIRPGMAFAVVKNAPVLGGTLKATPAIPAGATAVVNLGNAVAIVARNTWAAIMASKQLSASWTTPADAASNSSSAIRTTAQTLLASGTPVIAEPAGAADTGAALAAVGATPTVDATYYVPYLAHVPMEVPNATVEPTYADAAKTTLVAVDIWLPTQAPKGVLAALKAMTTSTGAPWIPATATVTVHPTLLGGGFGRKIETDYAVHAAKTALTLKQAVKVTWPREEDVTHDQYRPMALARIRATLDANKGIAGWHSRTVTPSISHQRGRLAAGAVDSAAIECLTLATGVPYMAASPTHATEWVRHPASVWVGYWRSVGASMNVFFSESAIDELASKAGLDEYAFRRQLLQASTDPRATRFIAVLDEVARISNWAAGAPAGRARGISVATCFGSVVAEVVEVSKVVNSTTGAVSMKVHNVWVALDCGNVVNPNAVEAQVQGAVAYGLSATLWSQITFTNGKADQANFNRYRMLRNSEMPLVTTTLIRTTADPSGGVGEVAVPGIAPAVATAWSKLNGGTRYRSLPLFPGATM